MTELSYCVSIGITPEQFYTYDDDTLRQLIRGKQLREDKVLRLLRNIAWNTAIAVGQIKEGTSIFDLYPLPLDREIKEHLKVEEKKKKKKAKEVFAKREAMKKKKNGKI